MALEEYRKKRDFKKTPEPKGKIKKAKGNSFVVQMHDATNLHYDLRLEISGVLKSWAVPKGISMDPKIKRLAIETEDHPLDYGNFEGVIPEGYGAGTVMIWDKGKYENIKEKKEEGKGKMSMPESYSKGQIEVSLKGKKLKGNFALIKSKSPMFGKNAWLLIKMNDEFANKSIPNADKSAKSGKTMKQIEKGAGK